VEGGKFFDAGTMKATVNSPVGVKVFTECATRTASCRPAWKNSDSSENLALFLKARAR